MEETVFIKSQPYNLRKTLILAIILVSLLALLVSFYLIRFVVTIESNLAWHEAAWAYRSSTGIHKNLGTHSLQCYFYLNDDNTYDYGYSDDFLNCAMDYPSMIAYVLPYCIEAFFHSCGYFVLNCYIGVLLVLLITYWWMKNCELVVTSSRVYGRAAFGRRVDLPQDSITAIGMSRLVRSICISTPSGRIRFFPIKNAEAIYRVINETLIARQEKAPAVTSSNADEIKKYKELLDTGAITQEEFDAKKKQLLGL